MAVEAVGKDVSALSAEERAAAVLRDAPELLVRAWPSFRLGIPFAVLGLRSLPASY